MKQNLCLVWARPLVVGSLWACALGSTSLFSSCARAAPPSAEALASIRAAAPAQPAARPQKARRVLVYTRASGFVHSSRETGAETMKILGEKTGAWTATHADDPSAFETLNQYDAVVFLNTTGAALLSKDFDKLGEAEKTAARERETRYRAALLSFVNSGKGFAGIHSATDTYWQEPDNWMPFREMIGGTFDQHPWNSGDSVTVRVEDPTHPIVRSLNGADMSFKEEIYQFKEPFDRKKQRVLLGLDLEKSQRKNDLKRSDRDYPVAWIKPQGNGRVFYTSLGHNEEIYSNPQVLGVYLAGIQYALGDLKADATPIAQMPPDYADAPLGEYASALGRGANASQVLARIFPEGNNEYRAVLYAPVARSRGEDALVAAMRGRRIEMTGTLAMRGGWETIEFSGKDGEADIKALWRSGARMAARLPDSLTITQAPTRLNLLQGAFSGLPLARVNRRSPSLEMEAPRGAIALLPFDRDPKKREAGPSLAEWKNQNWIPMRDGSVTVRGGDNVTRREFGDIRLHVEWMAPLMPQARGQGRGNSGVYLQERYEVQVLDSFGLDPQDNDAAGIYRVAKPPLNASLPPGQWQTYDILFRAPRLYTDGTVAQSARATVLLNGIKIHDNIEIKQPTGGGASGAAAKAPIKLQDHGNPVRYRNMWLLELNDRPWTPTANPDPNAGQRTLFDGDSLDAFAWGGGKPAPAIEEGAIAINGGGDIWTKDQYENFVLDLEYKVAPGGNSGVFIRNPKPGDWFGGMEIQVEDSHGKPLGVHIAGANYDVLAPTKNASKPAGEWNTMRITARGPNIVVDLNGERVLDQDLNRWSEVGKNPDGSGNKFKTAYKDMPRRGHIELQDHGQRVWYRNIKVRELK